MVFSVGVILDTSNTVYSKTTLSS